MGLRPRHEVSSPDPKRAGLFVVQEDVSRATPDKTPWPRDPPGRAPDQSRGCPFTGRGSSLPAPVRPMPSPPEPLTPQQRVSPTTVIPQV